MLPAVPGLRYVPEYLETPEHDRLLSAADAIPARHADTWLGREWPRERRVSLTFRKMRQPTVAKVLSRRVTTES